MKRSILIVFLLLATLVALHAGGRAEAETEEINGTVVTYTVDEDGYITAVLESEGVEYKLNIPQDELAAMDLGVGQYLTVIGVLVGKNDDSPDRIVVISVTNAEGETTVIKEPDRLTLRDRLWIRLNDGDKEPEKLQTRDRERVEAEESSNPDAARTRTEGEKD